MADANSITFGILTVSDRCFQGLAEDKSGPNLGKLVEALVPGARVVKRSCVPDEEDEIVRVLETWVDADNLDVVVTTGGTGFSPRDVTPEATLRVVSRLAPGLSVAMTQRSLDITPLAMLSRAVCGLRGGSLIINLPGSTKGSQECFEAVAMAVPHAVALARNRQMAHAAHSAHSPAHKADSRLAQYPPGHRHSCGRQHTATHTHVHTCGHRADGDGEVDPDLVARRLRESPFPMLPVPDAQQLMLAEAIVLGTEAVPVAQALGRVLAQTAHARESLPPFPASLKDGYAVVAADGSGPRLVVAAAAAGHEDPELCIQPGQCARINTGAALPAGADAVVQVEDTRLLKEADGGRTEVEIEILTKPTRGLDVRPLGSDIVVGQTVLHKGTVLGPAEIGLVCAVGLSEVMVHRQPRVAVLSTGDELQDAAQPLAPGRIRDTNRPTLQALLAQNGFATLDMGIARDNRESMLTNLQEALRQAEVVVTSGSVSMGDRDFLKQVLTNDLGATIHFGRINMKPGKPTTFATLLFEGQKRFVLGLPGNPVSATVTGHLFLIPLLKQLAGHHNPLPTVVKATIEGDYPLDPRPEYHRVMLTWSSDKLLPVAKSTGSQASSRLLSMASSNALLVLPAVSETCKVLRSGSTVDALLLAVR
ncbi:hypothetical protein R5R35_006122 [Gryllus longicercus]|uniref:MoaB/Mog domain-containing protein n=1 Tax=Gryllus longicercus TaxID=2509291 RepID=A0AAN9ZDX0_9ORTH